MKNSIARWSFQQNRYTCSSTCTNVGQNPLRTKPPRTKPPGQNPPDKTPSLFCMGRTNPPIQLKGTNIIHHISVKNIEGGGGCLSYPCKKSEGVLSEGVCPRGFCPEGVLSAHRHAQLNRYSW